jgi:hypothetical protein
MTKLTIMTLLDLLLPVWAYLEIRFNLGSMLTRSYLNLIRRHYMWPHPDPEFYNTERLTSLYVNASEFKNQVE